MKNIKFTMWCAVSLVWLTVLSASAQNNIVFGWGAENNLVTGKKLTDTFNLPLLLSFGRNDFNGKLLSLVTASDSCIALCNQKFGEDLSYSEEGLALVPIDDDGRIAVGDDNILLSQDFFVQVNEKKVGPIHINWPHKVDGGMPVASEGNAITYKWAQAPVTTNDLSSAIKFPITIKFDVSSFKGRKVSLVNASNGMVISEKIFGTDISAGEQGLFYAIKTDAIGRVTQMAGTVLLEDDFYVAVDDIKATDPVKIVTPNIPYYDALKLQELKEAGNNAAIESLLKRYGILGQATLDANPYLKNELGNVMSVRAGVQGGGGAFSFASVGNMDITTFADGAARFLAGRTKEELNAAFFDKLVAVMNKPQFEDLRILFPATYNRFKNIGTELYNYSVYLEDLRNDFQSDLAGVIDNFPQVLETEKYAAVFNANPELKAIVQSALYLTKQIKGQVHVADIINDYPVAKCFAGVSANSPVQNVKASLQTLKLVSGSLQSKYYNQGSKNYFWVNGDSILDFLRNDVAFKLYLGLLCQSAGDIEFYIPAGNKKLSELMIAHYADITAYNEFVRNFAYDVKKFQTAVADFKTREKQVDATGINKLTYVDYHNLYNSMLDVLDAGARARFLPGIPVIHTTKGAGPDAVDNYFTSARTLGNLVVDIKTESYAGIALDLTTLFTSLVQPIMEQRQAKIAAALSGINPNNPASLLGNSTVSNYARRYNLTLKQAYFRLNRQAKSAFAGRLISNVSVFSRFMASVSRAKSSSEIKDAIEAAALPMGSSSIKKKKAFNISLNCYVAPYYGYEHLKTQVPQRDISGNTIPGQFTDSVLSGRTVGIYAPVGLGFNVGLCPRTGNGGSLSIFVPVFDIGAFVAFRFKDDTSSLGNDVKVRLKNIFAPGVNLVYGFPRVPVSIGGGVSWAPALSKIYADKADIRNSTGLRALIFVGVDIPAVNIFTTKR